MSELKNYTEYLVDDALPNILKHYDNICKCKKCVQDIKALALNNLPPNYVSTEKGEVYVKVKNQLNLQLKVNIDSAIASAIEKVSKNPQHHKE